MIISNKTATVIHQSTTQTVSSLGSEWCASRIILQRANTTGKVGVRTQPLLGAFNNKVWFFIWKKPQRYIGWVQKYSTSPTPTHGGSNTDMHRIKPRIRLRFICSKARFYSYKGLFLKRVFSKQFFTWPYIEWGWSYTKDPSFNATGLLIRNSSRHNYRTLFPKHWRQSNPILEEVLVVWPNRNSPNTVGTAIRIGFTLCRVVQLYPQVGITARSP